MARGGIVDLSIIGDKETAALMRRLPTYLQKNIVSVALKEAIRPMHAAAKREIQALERGGGRMALVARKIKIKAIKRKRGLLGWRASPPPRVDLGIPKHHKYYYPRVVEYGTVDTPPNPFMFRAFMATKERTFKIARDLIWKGARLGWRSRA
jgi:HK97 gp10 family phage protein